MIDLRNPTVYFALEAVRLAVRLAKQVQGELVSPALAKEDRSPVTVADFAVQALIGSLLMQNFPNDVLVAEENSAALRKPGNQGILENSIFYVARYVGLASAEMVCRWIDLGMADPAERFWILDPIDGTKGFLRGDQYALALALVENGQVQIGVLGCPEMNDAQQPDFEGPGSLVIAVRGQGTWTASMEDESNFKKLSVSMRSQSHEARILRSFEAAHTNTEQVDRLAQELGALAEPVRMDSQAKYAVLAAGKGDLLLRMISPEQENYREKIWDQAAGAIVVEEAGGRITDLDGKVLDFRKGRTLAGNRGILASNGYLHEAALRALRTVEAYE